MIDILLSTYNGEKYLREQIESIIRQTETNWNIVIRDDGSTDNTVQIITDYANRYPGKIQLSPSSGYNVGVIKSFEMLLSESENQYIMFCDQDDIWLPNKISISLAALQLQERKNSLHTPILIHTDLTVIDENKNIIDESFWHYANIRPSVLNRNLKFLSICNSATGCTIMMNKACKSVVLPYPPTILMHDSWMASAVCQNGIIQSIPTPTIMYRQHGSNTLGANKYTHNPIRKILNLGRVLHEVPMIYNSCPNVFANKLDVFITKLRYSFLLFFTK